MPVAIVTRWNDNLWDNCEWLEKLLAGQDRDKFEVVSLLSLQRQERQPQFAVNYGVVYGGAGQPVQLQADIVHTRQTPTPLSPGLVSA
jgi:hypothetical protein